jgi:hypothetical protein
MIENLRGGGTPVAEQDWMDKSFAIDCKAIYSDV